MTRIVLGAHALHSGGGAVLLRAILPALVPHLRHAFVDTRFLGEARALAPGIPLTAVAPYPLARIAALHSLAREARPGDRLFAFNNAPPLVRSRARTVVYVRNAFLVCGYPPAAWSLRDRARLALERLILRLGRGQVDEFWVQTPHMARALTRLARGCTVRVMPLFDMGFNQACNTPTPISAARFLYPAGGWAYKRHAELYRAWAMLTAGGLRVTLAVTLDPSEHRRHLAAAGIGENDVPLIINLGTLARAETLAEIARSDAVVFPSDIEAFGIPLSEASALGIPILAPERSYVRDVCSPAQTFDPADPYSIADAVLRFLGRARAPIRPLDPRAFVEAILA